MMRGFRVAQVCRSAAVFRTRANYGRNFSSTISVRFFGGSKPDPNETIQKFTETLRTNPELGNLLSGFQTLLAEKGIATDGQPPSMTQMMRIMADKDIRDHLGKLKQALDDANIQITQQDLSALTDIYMKQQNNQ